VTVFSEIDASGSGLEVAVDRAVDGLRSGHLLAHPTETVYGIGGSATAATDARIAALKGRAATPLIRLVSDARTARRLFPDIRWSDAAEILADTFWPGPLTLVVDDGSRDGVAIRAEAHPVVIRVLRAWDRALTSTSLNRTTESPACTAGEARQVLRNLPACEAPVTLVAVDRLSGPPPSTLVSVRGEEVRILREARISEPEIVEALNREQKR